MDMLKRFAASFLEPWRMAVLVAVTVAVALFCSARFYYPEHSVRHLTRYQLRMLDMVQCVRMGQLKESSAEALDIGGQTYEALRLPALYVNLSHGGQVYCRTDEESGLSVVFVCGRSADGAVSGYLYSDAPQSPEPLGENVVVHWSLLEG